MRLSARSNSFLSWMQTVPRNGIKTAKVSFTSGPLRRAVGILLYLRKDHMREENSKLIPSLYSHVIPISLNSIVLCGIMEVLSRNPAGV